MTLGLRHGRTVGADHRDMATGVAWWARGRRIEDPAEDRTPLGITLCLGTLGVVATALVVAAIPTGDSHWRFGLMAAAVGLFAAISLDEVALVAVTVIAALVTNGFLENRAGQLTWHGSADFWRLLILVMVAAAGLAIGEAYRYLRRLRRSEPVPNVEGAGVSSCRSDAQGAEFVEEMAKEEEHRA